MKIFLLPLLLLLFVSCAKEKSGSSPESGGEGQSDRVEAAASSVQAAGDTAAKWTRSAGYWMADTWDSIQNASAESSAKVKEKLDEAATVLDKQIDLAQQKASELSGAAKEKVEQGIEGLKKAKNEIAEAGSRLTTATAEQWPEVQKELSEAWKQAGESMSEVWQATAGSGDSANSKDQ